MLNVDEKQMLWTMESVLAVQTTNVSRLAVVFHVFNGCRAPQRHDLRQH